MFVCFFCCGQACDTLVLECSTGPHDPGPCVKNSEGECRWTQLMLTMCTGLMGWALAGSFLHL